MFAGQMRIEPWDPTDETTALGCYEVHRAANQADEPIEPPMSAGTFGLFLREGFGKTPGDAASAVRCSCTRRSGRPPTGGRC